MNDSDKIWRCACGGRHYVSITAFKAGNEVFLSVDLHDRSNGLLDRIKSAVNILIHGKDLTGEVLLTWNALREFQDEVVRLVSANE